MNGRVFFWPLTSAVFLFGFDKVVISGAKELLSRLGA